MTLKHSFTSNKAEGADTTVVRPSDWNAAHLATDTTVVTSLNADLLDGSHAAAFAAAAHTHAGSDITANVDISIGTGDFIGDVFEIGGATGVWASAADGKLTLKGKKATGGLNEDLALDFDAAADTVAFTSSTGVAALTFAGMTLSAGHLKDGSLTSGRVPYATTGGQLLDSGNLLFDGTSITCAGWYKAGSPTVYTFIGASEGYPTVGGVGSTTLFVKPGYTLVGAFTTNVGFQMKEDFPFKWGGSGVNYGLATIAEATGLWTFSQYGTCALVLGAAGKTLAFYGGNPAAKPEVTGAKGGNAALASLLTALAGLGLLTDSSGA